MTAGSSTGLSAHLSLKRGSFVLELELELQHGEVLALLGANGAGKSTVLDVLSGLLAPGDSRVCLDGRMLTAPGIRVAPEHRRIAMLSQDPLLFPHLSALENVAFPLRARGRKRAEARASALEWLERMGLGTRASSLPKQLSGGQQQRVAIARALAAEPRVLLLDEPFASLDVETGPAMRQVLLQQLAARPTSVILVTHDVMDATVLADRVLVMADGRAVQEGQTGNVLRAQRRAEVAAIRGTERSAESRRLRYRGPASRVPRRGSR